MPLQDANPTPSFGGFGIMRNSSNVTGVAIATAIVAATMASMGFATDVDSVIDAGPGSSILSAFVSGQRIALLTMGSLTLVGAAASFFKGSRVETLIEPAGQAPPAASTTPGD